MTLSTEKSRSIRSHLLRGLIASTLALTVLTTACSPSSVRSDEPGTETESDVTPVDGIGNLEQFEPDAQQPDADGQPGDVGEPDGADQNEGGTDEPSGSGEDGTHVGVGPLEDLTHLTPVSHTEQALVQGSPPMIPAGWPSNPKDWTLDQHRFFEFKFWPRPGLGGIDESSEPWAWDTTRFWAQPLPAVADVDQARTAALRDPAWNVGVGVSSGSFWQGQLYGIPYQLADRSVAPTTVWSDDRQVTPLDVILGRTDQIVNERIPYPRSRNGNPFVRTEGDPNPGLNDRHSILVDPVGKRLYETFSMRDNTFGIHGASHVGQVTVWNTSRRWSESPGGGNAAKLPHFPLLPRKEEVIAGKIDHMLGLAMDRYNKQRTGPARGGDGLSTIHPVRSGERLRFTAEAYSRLYELNKNNRVAATMLTAGRDYGFVVMDKNSDKGDNEKGRAGITMPQDTFFDGKGFDFALSDLEVINW